MSVTSEVKIARRRVVEFVLSPMIRHRKESFREQWNRLENSRENCKERVSFNDAIFKFP